MKHIISRLIQVGLLLATLSQASVAEERSHPFVYQKLHQGKLYLGVCPKPGSPPEDCVGYQAYQQSQGGEWSFVAGLVKPTAEVLRTQTVTIFSFSGECIQNLYMEEMRECAWIFQSSLSGNIKLLSVNAFRGSIEANE